MENREAIPHMENSDKRIMHPFDDGSLRDLHTLSQKEILDRILAHPAPRRLIQGLPCEDLFWLVKKVGEEGYLQLLRLATAEQWQYILDLELWHKDRMDMAAASLWLGRLQSAAPGRLTEWLLTDGRALAYYYLSRNIEVEVRDPDDTDDLDEGFMTLDSLFYVKVKDPERKKTIENILRSVADSDLGKYRSLLSSLGAVLPAEMEEDMYRLKNVRLAEHGFLPMEEALIVYAPLDPRELNPQVPGQRLDVEADENLRDMAPHALLSLVEDESLLGTSLSMIHEDPIADRIRLEFAGLCNQVLSADNLAVNDLEVLRKTCRKSAGYLNLILEKRCGTDIKAAETLLRNNALVSLFRAGFGIAQRLKWEAEGWIEESWFRQMGFGLDFWGEEWARILAGLTAKRPLYYQGWASEDTYRDFEHIFDVNAANEVLQRVKSLDILLARLTYRYPLNTEEKERTGLTFHPLLFTFWARRILQLPLSFESIFLNQAKIFFRFLRGGAERPPYRMLGFEEVFIKDIMDAANGLATSVTVVLKETLSLIWQAFCQEYEKVPLLSLDPRYSTYLRIRSSLRSPAR